MLLSFFLKLSVNEDQRAQVVIGDIEWCEMVSNSVVQNMLMSCETMYAQVYLLRLLCHSRFGNGFSIKGKLIVYITSSMSRETFFWTFKENTTQKTIH